MPQPQQDVIKIDPYNPIPTICAFHRSNTMFRCIVGPVGSAKTSAATWEIVFYLSAYLKQNYGIDSTRWAILRNTYPELETSTMRTVFEWFPDGLFGKYRVQKRVYPISWDHPECGILNIELDFLACDRPDDQKKLKGGEFTGYWIDESIEVPQDIKLMLATRIGRYPKASRWPVLKDENGNETRDKDGNLVYDVQQYGIETTNPPDVEHATYSNFKWNVPPPGPVPAGEPLENHEGFWQPPYENVANLRYGYYDDLKARYRDNPDWIDIYIDGKPGATIRGKLVLHNFKRLIHVAKKPLIWAKGTLYRGWDHSGNCPACAVLQVPRANHIQILKEYTTDKKGIVDFSRDVIGDCNICYPDAQFHDWGDPAGSNKYSKQDGGFTSNTQLVYDEHGISIVDSEKSATALIEILDQVLGRIDGILIDPGCTRFISGLMGGYCYKKRPGTVDEYLDTVDKNRFSHIMEAVQYAVIKLTRGNVGAVRGGFHPRRKRRIRRAA